MGEVYYGRGLCFHPALCVYVREGDGVVYYETKRRKEERGVLSKRCTMGLKKKKEVY